MQLELAQLIGKDGSELAFSEQYDFSDMQFGITHPLTEPVKASGAVKNAAGVLTLTGQIETVLHGVCDRCAKPFTRQLSIPLHAVLEADPDCDEPEDLWTFSVTDNRADLDEIVTTALVFGLDGQMLCKEDCKGLCCRCGADLNLGPCSCKPEIDPRLAVLQSLLEK